jgi:uncharacterized protein (TIGR02466 family)
MKLFDIFPNPIFAETCEFHEEVKTSIENLNLQYKQNEVCQSLYHANNELSSSILYHPELKQFKSWVEKSCHEYITNVLGYHLDDTVIVTDSWINRCDKGGYQYPHYHTNSYISGTYYLNIKDNHAPLMFRHDDTCTHINKQSITLKKGSISTKYNSDVLFHPTEGELYLWQSHLTHAVLDNMADNRLSLSMNFMPTVVSNYKYGYKISI